MMFSPSDGATASAGVPAATASAVYLASATTRSYVNATAAALNGVLSWNTTPCFSLNVTSVPSSESSHDSASAGTIVVASGIQTSGSQTFSVTRIVESKQVTCGSSVPSTSKPSA